MKTSLIGLAPNVGISFQKNSGWMSITKMIDRRSRERIEKAKEVSIISYLKTCGYKPKKIGGLYATYLSPLRPENNPSFVINLRKNTWAD